MGIRVGVVGGNGTLGSALCAELAQRGHEPVVLSRSARAGVPYEHRPIDLTSGVGLPDALDGIGTVVDASNAQGRGMKAVLVEGTGRLLAAEAGAGVAHHVLVSIIGIEQVPIGYYKTKLAQEAALGAASVPTTTFRATQFHDLLDMLFTAAARTGWLPGGAIRLQPVAVGEVAAALADVVDRGPGNGADRVEFAGPRVEPLGDLSSAWKRAAGKRRITVALPSVGGALRALHAGGLTSETAPRGSVTFADWLAAR